MINEQASAEQQPFSVRGYFHHPVRYTYSSRGNSDTACTSRFSLDANSCATLAGDEESTSSSPDVPADVQLCTGVARHSRPLPLPRGDHADVQLSPQQDELGEILQEIAHDESCPYLRQLTHPTLLSAYRLATTLPAHNQQTHTALGPTYTGSPSSPPLPAAHFPAGGPYPACFAKQQSAAYQPQDPLPQPSPAAGSQGVAGHKQTSRRRRTSESLSCSGCVQVRVKGFDMYGVYSMAEQIRTHATSTQLLMPQLPQPLLTAPLMPAVCGHTVRRCSSCGCLYASAAYQWLS